MVYGLDSLTLNTIFDTFSKFKSLLYLPLIKNIQKASLKILYKEKYLSMNFLQKSEILTLLQFNLQKNQR